MQEARSVAAKLTAKSMGAWRRHFVFVRNFLKHPLMVGSFFQSSPRLVARIVESIDWERARTVVEYGPGVGTITTALLARLPRDGRLIAIEMNPEFVNVLEGSIDDSRFVVEAGSAADVADALRRAHRPQADVIVSGIPFSTMSEHDRSATVAATRDALAPGGRFVVYQYSRKVLPLLRRHFSRVDTAIEWRNGLPMQVFVAEC